MNKPHILVGLYGTLAQQPVVYSADHIPLAVPAMLERVRTWLSRDKAVLVFTSKAATPEGTKLVRDWLDGIGLDKVGITDRVTEQTEEIWHSKAVGVVPNKGITVESMVAYELIEVLKAAGIEPRDGMTYSEASRHASAKVRKALKTADDVTAHVGAAVDALDYIKTDALAKLDLRGEAAKTVATLIGDLERAKRAMSKAHKALKS